MYFLNLPGVTKKIPATAKIKINVKSVNDIFNTAFFIVIITTCGYYSINGVQNAFVIYNWDKI